MILPTGSNITSEFPESKKRYADGFTFSAAEAICGVRIVYTEQGVKILTCVTKRVN